MVTMPGTATGGGPRLVGGPVQRRVREDRPGRRRGRCGPLRPPLRCDRSVRLFDVVDGEAGDRGGPLGIEEEQQAGEAVFGLEPRRPMGGNRHIGCSLSARSEASRSVPPEDRARLRSPRERKSTAHSGAGRRPSTSTKPGPTALPCVEPSRTQRRQQLCAPAAVPAAPLTLAASAAPDPPIYPSDTPSERASRAPFQRQDIARSAHTAHIAHTKNRRSGALCGWFEDGDALHVVRHR